jgi:PrtD family type I secretion system ABC transporter
VGPVSAAQRVHMQLSLSKVIFRRSLFELGIFCLVLNILVLVQPLYMLQVYDRVLASANTYTLYYLTIIAVGALLFMGLLEVVRQNYASRMAARLEPAFGAAALMAASQSSNASLGDVQPLRDLAAVRGFLSSKLLFAIFDLPFAPLFLIVLYLIHPAICLLTIVGIVLLALLTWLNQVGSARGTKLAMEKNLSAMLNAQAIARSAETIRAMGMERNAVERWGAAQAESLQALDHVNGVNSFYGGMSRALRLFLQIAILGLGAYYVLQNEMTGGMIFASSLISGKAMQPLDQIIGSWRQITDAKAAWNRLKLSLSAVADRSKAVTELPAPKGEIAGENLVYSAPSALRGGEPLIKRLNFRIPAGSSLAIVGPSGAGKSTLARLLVGAIEPTMGSVRIDGADIKQWDKQKLGKHIGYLSQDADMLPGTVSENISRFTPGVADADVVNAAKMASVHELILALPAGYNTLLGPGGLTLSGGQRQRIGLARAFFGGPRVLVLDEPNANLDAEGDAALDRALQEARKTGATVIVITQRKAAAERADRIMIIRDGAIEDYGPKAAVAENQNRKMQEMQRRIQTPPANQLTTNEAMIKETAAASPEAGQ